MPGETYLGKSKYDGRIRRVTLIKKVAEMLDMHDGDILTYWEIGHEVVIRKEVHETEEGLQVSDIIPVGTPYEEVKMMLEAAFEIGDYYNANRSEPTGVEMIEITEKAARHFPDTFSKEKRGEMLRMSIELAKNIISRTRIIPLVGDEPEERKARSWKNP